MQFLFPKTELREFAGDKVGKYGFVPVKLESKLAKTKSELDRPYKTREGSYVMNLMDPFIGEKVRIAKQINNYNISNAWLKCYEMLYRFDMIPKGKSETFLHFDNAAFPGSFILAAHHYANSLTNVKYEWKASSLFDEKDKTRGFVGDSYKLWKNYPKNWLMNFEPNSSQRVNNGDVTNPENIRDFEKQFDHSVDLYTSDLGFDVSEDYNKQEYFHQRANLGQIACGIAVLKSGGNFITKQYSYFCSMNVGIMFMLAGAFEKFYVHKPITSKADNSETYLVGIGFDAKKREQILAWCFTGLDPKLGKNDSSQDTGVKGEVPADLQLVPESAIGNDFIKVLTESYTIFEAQIKAIESDIKTFDKVFSKKRRSKQEMLDEIFDLENYRTIIDRFYKLVHFKPINSKKRLKMEDKFRQLL